MGLRIVSVTGRSFFVPSRRLKQPLARLIVLLPSCLRLTYKALWQRRAVPATQEGAPPIELPVSSDAEAVTLSLLQDLPSRPPTVSRPLANHPGSSRCLFRHVRPDLLARRIEALGEERLGVDREQHPDLADRVSRPRYAHRPPNALGLNYRPETSGAAAHLNQDPDHVPYYLSARAQT